MRLRSYHNSPHDMFRYEIPCARPGEVITAVSMPIAASEHAVAFTFVDSVIDENSADGMVQ